MEAPAGKDNGVQVKTTLGKVFEAWKRNNDGTDQQIMERLGATPAQYRELLGEVLKPETSPTSAPIRRIAQRHGISTDGLTSIIEGI